MKLDSGKELCMLVGYPKGTTDGSFYNPKKQTMSKPVLEELSGNTQSPMTIVTEPSPNSRAVNEQQHGVIHRSGREDHDSLTYDEAMHSVDSKLWK
ncbi:hypothetical protein EPI10_021391 [Gossypium australe]|uniref:Uncharacterized protein n=1 Tax=Gossypium australe TaxID=47621 RepID=A0A5B6WH42_9ROSI|nr:hypothetical protein EPI10_021391 [Gossypium australe]